MDSERINRWLTLGANLGVLIGIILLVVELAQNREMMRAQIRNDISQQLTSRISMMANNPQTASLKRRAEAGEELSADEEYQYFLLFVATFRDWENIHYQYRHEMFDESEFDAERSTWKFLINRNQAFERNWCLTRRNYSSMFVAEIEGLIHKEICKST